MTPYRERREKGLLRPRSQIHDNPEPRRSRNSAAAEAEVEENEEVEET